MKTLKITQLWIFFDGPGDSHAVMAAYDNDRPRPRAVRRTNTLLGAEAELLGLARENGLRVSETEISGAKFLTAAQA